MREGDHRRADDAGESLQGFLLRNFAKDSLDVVVILVSGNFGPCFELVLAFIMLTYAHTILRDIDLNQTKLDEIR